MDFLPGGFLRRIANPTVNQAWLSGVGREYWPDVGELETEKRFPRRSGLRTTENAQKGGAVTRIESNAYVA